MSRDAADQPTSRQAGRSASQQVGSLANQLACMPPLKHANIEAQPHAGRKAGIREAEGQVGQPAQRPESRPAGRYGGMEACEACRHEGRVPGYYGGATGMEADARAGTLAGRRLEAVWQDGRTTGQKAGKLAHVQGIEQLRGRGKWIEGGGPAAAATSAVEACE